MDPVATPTPWLEGGRAGGKGPGGAQTPGWTRRVPLTCSPSQPLTLGHLVPSVGCFLIPSVQEVITSLSTKGWAWGLKEMMPVRCLDHGDPHPPQPLLSPPGILPGACL